MARARVAVLMSTYDGDREAWVAECLDSLLAQTEAVDVHVYLDGVARRPLRELVHAFAAKHPSVTVYEHPANRGPSPCLNQLITALRGRYEYLARMDADDVALPRRFALQAAYLDAHPDVDVVGGAIVEMDERGRDLRVIRYPAEHEAILRLFRQRNPLANVTAMFRARFFDKAGLYPDLRRNEDTLLWMNAFLAGCRVANLGDVVVRVRRSDAFLARRTGPRVAWDQFRVRLVVNRRLRLGPLSYAWALVLFGVRLSPVPVKRFLYAHFR